MAHRNEVRGEPEKPLGSASRASLAALVCGLAILSLLACSPKPLTPYSRTSPPLVLAPASTAGIEDARGRFREIFCDRMQALGEKFPNQRPCNEALVQLRGEPPPSGRAIHTGEARAPMYVVAVPGFGWRCLESLIDPNMNGFKQIEAFGWTPIRVDVHPFSSSATNARPVRDAVMAVPAPDERNVVLVGYSKGIVDILEALIQFPEMQARVAGVVSVAGAVGGSPLANNPPDLLLKLLENAPGSGCTPGDGRALESLRPEVRHGWLDDHELPEPIRYYSLVAYPDPKRISRALQASYDSLAQIDPRNDSQLIFYDQVIPGSVLLGYAEADHWSIAIWLDQSQPLISRLVIEDNAYPREVLLDAILHFVEEDLLAQR